MASPDPQGARPASTPRPSSLEQALPRTIVAATLVAALLRLFRLGHQSLWIDEQFTLVSAGLPGPFVLHDLLDNVHGPLYSVVVAWFAAWGGTSEWVLRLPSALAGIAMVPAMAWLASRWLGRATAAPAAWLTAASPFLVWYSQECRNYAFLLLATVLATAALLELQQHVRPARLAGYAAAAIAGVLSNFAFLLLAPLHLRLWLASGPGRAVRLRWLAGAVLLAALVALPWLPAVRGTWDWSRLQPGRAVPAAEEGLRGAHTFHPAAIPFALHAFTMGYSGGPSLADLRSGPEAAARAHLPELLLALLVFAPLGAVGLRAVARRGRLADTLLWLVAPTLVVSYFAANNFKVFHPRYVAVSMPCLLLVVAAAFADLGTRWRRVAAVAVALLWAGSLARATFEPEYGREDYRTAMATVRAGFVPGERVIAVGAPEPVEWYGRGLPVQRFWLGYASSEARCARAWRDSVGTVPPGVWVVASRTEDLDAPGNLAHWLDRATTTAERGAFNGVHVWHLSEHGPFADTTAGAASASSESR